MIAITKAEAALIIAKAECFKVCGSLDPSIASDRGLAEKFHEPHRAQLEAAYLAFQRASGERSDSNPASGVTQMDAILMVDSGLK